MKTPSSPSVNQTLGAWMKAAEESGSLSTKAKAMLKEEDDRVVLVNHSLVEDSTVFYVDIVADLMELSPKIEKARKFDKSEIVEFLFSNALIFGIGSWDCQLVSPE